MENSRDHIAIRTIIELPRYGKLLQGPKNSPSMSQRILYPILEGRKDRDVWVFIEDIRLGACTTEGHLESPKSFLNIFLKTGVTLRLSKYNFGVRWLKSWGMRSCRME